MKPPGELRKDGCYTWETIEDYQVESISWGMTWCKTGWWFQIFLVLFSPQELGKIPIVTNIVQLGWFNHQLDKDYQSSDETLVAHITLRKCLWYVLCFHLFLVIQTYRYIHI